LQRVRLRHFVLRRTFQNVAGLILLAEDGTEETELRGFANHQPDFFTGHFRFGAFFHSEGHDTKIAKRTRRAGNGQSRRFDPHVVRARRATTNAHALALLRGAIVGRAASDGEIQV
jgi:hypothetical protein